MPVPRITRLLTHRALALGVLLLGACAAPSPGAALATATTVRTLVLELRDTAYDLPRLELATSEVVDLALNNIGALDHDFTIDTMPGAALVLGTQTAEHQEHAQHAAVHGAPGPGKSVTLRLQPTAAGEYAYYCSIKGHREAGMTGKLVVR